MENQVLSIKQIQELLELGIDTSKASCCWCKVESLNRVGFVWMILPEHLDKCDEEHIPTFTLQDILEMLPKVIMTEEDNFELYLNTSQHYAQYRDSKHNVMLNIEFGNSILKAAFNMLKWCKLNNYV